LKYIVGDPLELKYIEENSNFKGESLILLINSLAAYVSVSSSLAIVLTSNKAANSFLVKDTILLGYFYKNE